MTLARLNKIIFSILKYCIVYLPKSMLLRLVKVLNDVENIYSLDFND